MPSIVSFRRNVGHAVILIILFSIFLLGYPCLSIYPPTFRDHSIYVDGERWFSTKLFYYLLKEAEYLHENVDRSLPYHEYWEAHIRAGSAACAYASKYGFMDVDSIMLCIHKYLNVYSARECLDSGNYILKLLAVLDRRIGKRTVKKLADNISNEPEWFRKFILLRAEGEGIHCRIEPNSKIT